MLAIFYTILDRIVRFLFDFPFFDVYFIGRPLNILSTSASIFLRLCSGNLVAGGLDQCQRPAKTLKLYEYEACPFCRKVREAMSVLDLDVDIFPCPKPVLFGKYGVADSTSRFRLDVKNPDGMTQFPVLVDENKFENTTIRGSDSIIAHLWEMYGKKIDGSLAQAPWNYRAGQFLDKITPLFFLPILLRPHSRSGVVKVPSKHPKQPLELWGFESSPFVKIVREALCVLELPYRMINVAHGSLKRQKFLDRFSGKMYQNNARLAVGAIQVPALIDPNRQEGKEEPIFESAYIVSYLFDRYESVKKNEE